MWEQLKPKNLENQTILNPTGLQRTLKLTLKLKQKTLLGYEFKGQEKKIGESYAEELWP